jgi:hypothetical protein
MAVIVRADGSRVRISPSDGFRFTKEEVKKIINGDGDIEIVWTNDGRMMILDENAVSIGKTVNPHATEMITKNNFDLDVCGDVVVCSKSEIV